MARSLLVVVTFLFLFAGETVAGLSLGSLVKTVTSTVGTVVTTLTNKTSTVGDTLVPSYSIQDANATARSVGVLLKQAAFLYGAPVAGGPYFPTGVLGLAHVAADQALIELELVPQTTLVGLDMISSAAAAADYNGLKTLDDYILLYENHLSRMLPGGPELGALTNFTQDLFFSMERLANSPYKIRRLNPASDTLQFSVDDFAVKNIANSSLAQLFQSGRLFYADYRDQKNLTQAARYSAACDAYFYIDSTSGRARPLSGPLQRNKILTSP